MKLAAYVFGILGAGAVAAVPAVSCRNMAPTEPKPHMAVTYDIEKNTMHVDRIGGEPCHFEFRGQEYRMDCEGRRSEGPVGNAPAEVQDLKRMVTEGALNYGGDFMDGVVSDAYGEKVFGRMAFNRGVK
jgi:hypothetical protein